MQVEHGHPPGLYVLFFTEMWERFSYYGMRALLVFYATETFRYSDDQAFAVYGSYTALVYLLPVLGGILGDRILGYRSAVITGAALMMLGHFFMAIERQPVFYFALALLIVGNGFFKANMSTIVGRLYEPGDPRRDAGYTIFYMAVNVGSALATLLCGWVGGKFGWNWGFTLAGFGMAVGLTSFVIGQHRLEGRADLPGLPGGRWRLGAYVGAVLTVGVIWRLLHHPELVGWLLALVQVGSFVFLIGYSFFAVAGPARHRMWVALTLTAVSVVFWAFFEQAGSSLNLFADRNVDTAGVPAPVMQVFNPAFIILLAPLFAALWVRLEKVDRDPTIPAKFGLGIVLLGLGFVALYYGAWTSRDDGVVWLGWLALGYLLQTMGELCLSPVGLSMISKLSPPRITGMMMGAWFLAISLANYAAAVIAKFTSVRGEAGGLPRLDPVDTVMIYGNVFGRIALVALVVGFLMLAVSPLLHRGTHGVR